VLICTEKVHALIRVCCDQTVHDLQNLVTGNARTCGGMDGGSAPSIYCVPAARACVTAVLLSVATAAAAATAPAVSVVTAAVVTPTIEWMVEAPMDCGTSIDVWRLGGGSGYNVLSASSQPLHNVRQRASVLYQMGALARLAPLHEPDE
jgi:hypothetical protein